MIRHVVLVKLRNADDAPKIFAALKLLQNQIPGIVDIRCGRDCSPEGLQRGFTHGFTVDFVDAAARDAYFPHPAPQTVGAMSVTSAEVRGEGMTVVDWEA